MRKLVISDGALDELTLYKSGNQNLVFKIFELLSDIQRHPYKGLGKPEPLKHVESGYWSRRINAEHRLINKVTDDAIEIYRCFGHYVDD